MLGYEKRMYASILECGFVLLLISLEMSVTFCGFKVTSCLYLSCVVQTVPFSGFTVRIFKPPRLKTNNLHRRKQRRRSASR